MPHELNIASAHAADLDAATRAEIIALCTLAYEEDFARLFEMCAGSIHVLGRVDGELVSHALWVERWLQPADLPPLRTAYVEAVATHPAYQRRGYAAAVMRELAAQIRAYDLGGLSPFDVGYYARLGWELWTGPLAIRTTDGLLPTPDEEVMILRLPHTPTLDVHAPMTAEWRVGELW
jgi:aminoglycoside 2'-N-acetyltransferase I